MVEKVRIEGLKELQDMLRNDLPKATAKNVMKRVLMKRGQPIADAMKQMVPVRKGSLRNSIKVATALSRRQKGQHKKDGPDDVEVFIGPGPHPEAHMQEFGTFKDKPQPYVRPAWDREKMNALEGIRDDLWTEIRNAAERLARKAAKAKG